jgi:hypothetical protein
MTTGSERGFSELANTKTNLRKALCMESEFLNSQLLNESRGSFRLVNDSVVVWKFTKGFRCWGSARPFESREESHMANECIQFIHAYFVIIVAEYLLSLWT